MEKLMGRKSVLMCLLGMMVILLGATAQAALITGSISFGAHEEPILTGGTNLGNNTGFSWPPGSNAHVIAGTGNFVPFINADTTFSAFTFFPLVPGSLLWTIDTTTNNFKMNTATIPGRFFDGNIGVGFITILGTGIFDFAGFDPTPGAFIFQSNSSSSGSGGTSITFSSGAQSIPEPGTLILLGSGLLGMVVVGRKKFRG